MIYVKSILVGLVAAVLSLALLIAATIFASLKSEQSSGLGAVAGGVDFNSNWVSGIGILFVGVIVFAAGFTWQYRRSLRRASPR
jgi:heme/copper-type cytochrome/quinol oxidase subunit 2